jgi:hypothetical protein
METATRVNRRFRKDALKMLEQSRVMLNKFIEYMPLFTDKFSELNVAFATAWQTAIDDADDAPDDEQVVSDQHLTTYGLYNSLRDARNSYTELVIYLKMAFPKNIAVLEHFGQKQYMAARKKPLEMKLLLELAHERAQSADYKTALNNQGFDQTMIDGLNTLAQQLENSNNTQKQAKTDRYMQTQNRNHLLNAVWEKMTLVNLASIAVMRGDYARRQLFKLYPERRYGKRENVKIERNDS